MNHDSHAAEREQESFQTLGCLFPQPSGEGNVTSGLAPLPEGGGIFALVWTEDPRSMRANWPLASEDIRTESGKVKGI